MPRGKVAAVDRPVRIHISIPESLYARVNLILYSEVEGRIPYGALASLYEQLLREWLESRDLNLEAFGIQGTVRGPIHTLQDLQNTLTQYQLKERTET